MEREIISPRWGSESKTSIICKFRYSDGRVLNASISVPEGGTNPDWDEIMEKFGVEYLDNEAIRQLDDHNKRKATAINQRQIDMERQQKEILFNAKAEAFDMEVVKNSTNREVKNKIRRATSIMEVHVYTAMLHIMEDPIANPPAEETTTTA
jgi:hypothetical protein